ncbi:sugar kinase [Leucobacter luti]|uniref:2-dehydro-3-deoxygluconokinase n=1 Tax=Leucobacter luti TaxID=340320 RepID=A0A4Q7U235_9MICO|nr:sugar kinase [Leucobacter luti]MBL3699367.1 sugar kinase [Leucobacter luti]RZT66877.1 2-dehydro-3-deoxygluconokinase [Leucobacter luti]
MSGHASNATIAVGEPAAGRGEALPYVVTLGESMGLLRQQVPGRLVTQRAMEFGFGGAESNVAIALSRLGVEAVWCGRLGTDSPGELIARELRAEGVHPRIVWDAAAPTGLMLKERPTAGTSRVVYYRSGSAGSRLAPDDLPAGLIEGAALVHVTGITPALSGSADAAVESALRRACAAGVPTSIDLNYRSALWGAAAAGARLSELVALADLVFAGDDEAALVAGARPVAELAAELRRLGPREAVIKLGERGCYVSAGDETLTRAAVPVTAVDTVGAGDAFVAGYLAEWLAGAPLAQRCDTAVRAGAFACLTAGDWEGLPRRADFALLDAGDPVQR